MQLASLIARFLDLVLPPTDTARIVREAREEKLGALLSPQLVAPDVIALLPYRHSLVRALVIEAKFHRNERAYALLGAVLADYLEAMQEEEAPFGEVAPILVPIPLGVGRRRERGYNQIEEILRAAGLPYQPLLQRVRETLPQTTLPRAERLRNMEGAFAADQLDAAHTYIVLDDVTTTGATLAAAADALRAAGATTVQALALAH